MAPSRQRALLLLAGIAAGVIAFAATLPRASVRVETATPEEPPPVRLAAPAPVASCCEASPVPPEPSSANLPR